MPRIYGLPTRNLFSIKIQYLLIESCYDGYRPHLCIWVLLKAEVNHVLIPMKLSCLIPSLFHLFDRELDGDFGSYASLENAIYYQFLSRKPSCCGPMCFRFLRVSEFLRHASNVTVSLQYCFPSLPH